MNYLLLVFFISISYQMVSQDTLDQNNSHKELSKTDALQNPEKKPFVFNNPFKQEVPEIASIQDPVLHAFVFNYHKDSDINGVMYIGQFNLARGSVQVTAGDRQLQEGIDFTVNCQIGTVQIINPSYAANPVPILIAVKK